jgi:hypothetical protein
VRRPGRRTPVGSRGLPPVLGEPLLPRDRRDRLGPRNR